MKYFLSLLVLSTSVFAQTSMEVQTVKNFSVDDGMAKITFDDESIIRLSEDSGFVPCFKVGWEAPQKVLIKRDQNHKVVDCKLYSGGGWEIQAQEEPKK